MLLTHRNIAGRCCCESPLKIKRLLSNIKTKDRSRQSWDHRALNAMDLQNAENIWIRYQYKHLAEELKYLQGKNKAWRPSLVSQLDLFIDGSGVIRCKGRLQNAEISASIADTEEQCPVSNSHHFSPSTHISLWS